MLRIISVFWAAGHFDVIFWYDRKYFSFFIPTTKRRRLSNNVLCLFVCYNSFFKSASVYLHYFCPLLLLLVAVLLSIGFS